MPDLYAVGANVAERTTRICWATNSAGTSWMANTPSVFWAVSAVSAVAA